MMSVNVACEVLQCCRQAYDITEYSIWIWSLAYMGFPNNVTKYSMLSIAIWQISL